MSIQNIVLGFEPTTAEDEPHPITTRPRLPPKTRLVLLYILFKAELWNLKSIQSSEHFGAAYLAPT